VKKQSVELEGAEEQLRQAQKMEGIGRLAGGVAHDFNNLLTIIGGYSDLVLNKLKQDEPLYDHVSEVKRAADRAASLTRQLLAFSRKQVLVPKLLDLNTVVREMDKMLRRLICEDIELVTLLSPNLGQIKVDPGQIEQVIMNLALNARDAMPRGGKLTIQTSNVNLAASEIIRQERELFGEPDVHSNQFVVLTMSDTGCGMDEQTKTHVFEPFFTTKEMGRGTGLGLATVYGVVKQSGGAVSVYSEPGHGTTFKVYLPRISQVVEHHLTPIVSAPVAGGTETILLVEDEEKVRTLARAVLQSGGYQVLEACHGHDAVQIAERHVGRINLLLTDVVMPKLGGRGLAEHLRPAHPNLAVLFMSGYTDDHVIRHGILEAETAFLQKPFSPTGLLAKVREVLDDQKIALDRGRTEVGQRGITECHRYSPVIPTP
jgi:two-component system, cell cycle sensor histidine kinase and response regulator CckA